MIREPSPPEGANGPNSAAEPTVRRGVWLIICLATLTTVAALWLAFRPRSTTPSPSAATSLVPSEVPTESRSTEPASGLPAQSAAKPSAAAKAVTPVTASMQPPATGAPPDIWTGPQPTAEARELVARLLRIDGPSGLTGAARAAEWKRDLEQVVQQGDVGVAAIREFLTTGTNYDFGVWGQTNLGFASARLALFDVLSKAGTGSAQAALAEALQNTLEPVEVGTVLRQLETLAPGQYREQALQAARQTLAAAERGELPGRDPAPAFEILQKFGGAEAVAELGRLSDKYPYYSTIALSELSDGAGLPLLIAMSRGEAGRASGATVVAQQMLASLAPDNPTALAALLDLVRSDRIAPNGWAFLATPLEGRKFSYEESVLDPQPAPAGNLDAYRAHIVPENQRYYQALDPAASTPEWTARQLALIDQLLAETKDRAAVEQLQGVRAVIQARQQPPGGAPP